MIDTSHQLTDNRFHRDLWRDAAAIYFGIAPNAVTRRQRSDMKFYGQSYVWATFFCENWITRALRLAGFKLPYGQQRNSFMHDLIVWEAPAHDSIAVDLDHWIESLKAAESVWETAWKRAVDRSHSYAGLVPFKSS